MLDRTMEIQAIWNRMDQLERLTISQAREIENLKRGQSYFQHQVLKQLSSDPRRYQLSKKSLAILRPYSTAITPLSHDHQAQLSAPATSNGIIHFPIQPYPINSFIHPTSAIPPVANRAALTRHPNHRPSTNASESLSSMATSHWPANLTNSLDLDLDPGLEISSDKKKRLRCIELLNCFCPCFSMC